MTTAYLTLCSIRDYLGKLEASEIQALAPQIFASSVDTKGNDVSRCRVTLQYEDSCGVLETIAKGDEVPNGKAATRSVRNILGAYEVINSFLESEFKDESAVRRFYAYFKKKVKLIRVKTVSVKHALKILAFEIRIKEDLLVMWELKANVRTLRLLVIIVAGWRLRYTCNMIVAVYISICSNSIASAVWLQACFC